MKEKNLKIQTHSVITDLQKAKERSIFQFSQIVCVGIKKKNLKIFVCKLFREILHFLAKINYAKNAINNFAKQNPRKPWAGADTGFK